MYSRLFEQIYQRRCLREREDEAIYDAIRRNHFDEVPEHFYRSLLKARHDRWGFVLSPYTLKDLRNKYIKTYKIPHANAGFALKTYPEWIQANIKGKDIVAVHNASGQTSETKLDLSKPDISLIKKAIELGGMYLNCFDHFLPDMYAKFGFEEYNRYDYDPYYDQEGKIKNGYAKHNVLSTPGVVYMKLKDAPIPPPV